MFDRFSDRSRRVLVLAQGEARRLEHDYIGTEHLLLGLLDESGGVAAMSLCSLGVTIEQTRDYVAEWVGIAKSGGQGSPGFTEKAKHALELSLNEAAERGDSAVGTGHLLQGLVREGTGVACQVLIAQGADLDEVTRITRTLMSGHEGSAGDTPPVFPVGDAHRLLRSLWASEMIRPPKNDDEQRLWDQVARELAEAPGELPGS